MSSPSSSACVTANNRHLVSAVDSFEEIRAKGLFYFLFRKMSISKSAREQQKRSVVTKYY